MMIGDARRARRGFRDDHGVTQSRGSDLLLTC
jgi:hypothetical protein